MKIIRRYLRNNITLSMGDYAYKDRGGWCIVFDRHTGLPKAFITVELMESLCY